MNTYVNIWLIEEGDLLRSLMKKVISLSLLLCIVLLFAVCKNKGPRETSIEDNIAAHNFKSKKAKLYALAFDAALRADGGGNSSIEHISIDTKNFKDFKDEDKKELFEYIREKYKATVLDMSLEELDTAGYIKKSTFEKGVLFYLGKYNSYSATSASFYCAKWSSALGSSGFYFEGEYKKNKWRIKKFDRTFVS